MKGLTSFVVLGLLGIIFFLYTNQPAPVQVITPGSAQPIAANSSAWQTFSCEVNGTMTPCPLRSGDELEAWGVVTSRSLKDSNTGQRLEVSATGVADKDPESIPYVKSLPRFALIGRMKGDSHPFLFGTSYTLQQSGELELMVNGDYRDKFGRPHLEWFNTENSGQFTVRLKR